jgi:hypothetical protein
VSVEAAGQPARVGVADLVAHRDDLRDVRAEQLDRGAGVAGLVLQHRVDRLRPAVLRAFVHDVVAARVRDLRGQALARHPVAERVDVDVAAREHVLVEQLEQPLALEARRERRRAPGASAEKARGRGVARGRDGPFVPARASAAVQLRRMSQPDLAPPTVEDRLARFRAMMAKLDATGDPARALERELYVTFPGAVGAKIAGRLELRPASTHLVVGGVGSGKTTELLQVRARLSSVPDTKAIYIDVTRQHDIARMGPGVVALQAALAIASFVTESIESRGEPSALVEIAATALRRLAHGYHYDPERDYYDTDVAYREGALKPPDQMTGVSAEALGELRPLLESPGAAGARLVVLLDGLDRLSDVEVFQQIVDDDVNGLASLGIGVVLIGPLKCLYRSERVMVESFDYWHHQPWRDPEVGNAERFLTDVVRRRLTADELDDASLLPLVRQSGGVLRDLIALAQLACEEAYVDGADRVGRPHVEAAADAFGRKHVIGLQADEIEILQRVRSTGSFVQTSETDLALLMTRRVLEYASGAGAASRYAVHPTIEPLLRQMAGEAT